MVSLTGINPAVETDRRCVLHMLPSQALNAQALLAYIKNALGSARVGVLYDTGYGQVIMDSLKAQAAQYGVQFVAAESFEIGATPAEVLPQARKVKAADPEAVIVVGLSAAPFIALRETEAHVPIVSAIASATYDSVKAMGPAANNIRFAEFVVGEDPLPHQMEFIAAFQKQYGHMPKSFEANAWDGLHVAARALSQAGINAPGPKLCEAMRKPYEGVLGSFDFSAADQTGLTLKSFVYSKVTLGKFSRLPFRNKEPGRSVASRTP
jgi:branched-chain amino acid transport system substrate-binding protein